MTAPTTTAPMATPTPPEKRRRNARPTSSPVTMAKRAAASCSTTQASTENASAQPRLTPYSWPARAQVVTVPGPINAAAKTDHRSTLISRDMA
jgi:hypothetical protein